MGLDIYLVDKKTGKFAEQTPDPRYPEHLFNTAYLRSSYNEGGINNILSDAGQLDLYGLFAYDEDKEKRTPEKDEEGEGTRYFEPDWDASAERVKKALQALRDSSGLYRSTFVSSHVREKKDIVSSNKQMMKVFNEQLSKEHPPGFKNYGNSLGKFMLDGTKIYAIVPGIDDTLAGILPPRVGAYYVYKCEGDVLQSYIESLEITLAFIENGKKNDLGMYFSR